MRKLSRKIAIVSGGTGALGRVVVEHLLSDGVDVITTMSGITNSSNYINKNTTVPLRKKAMP